MIAFSRLRSPSTRVPLTALALTVIALLGVACAEATGPTTAAVAIAPDTAVLAVGDSRQLVAVARDGAGDTLSGRNFTWTSSDASVATVSAGLVTALGAGTTTITATADGVSGTATLTVYIPVETVNVTAPSGPIMIGATVQLAATTLGALGDTLTGRTIAWTSSDLAIATVDAGTGLVTGVAAGSATITATSEGKSGTTSVTVLQPVATVGVAPAASSIEIGATAQLSAATLSAAGDTLTGRTVAWTTSDAAIATVGASSGLVTGVAAGSATITARSEGKTGTATVTVNPPVASVSVSPVNANLAIAGTQQLTATPLNGEGEPVTGLTAAWSTSNAAVATVNASGLVTGVTMGFATITATVDGKSGTARMAVAVPVGQLPITPSNPMIVIGATQQLRATPLSAAGDTLFGRTVTWESLNTAVATVSATGLVTGVSAGTVIIRARSENRDGSASVRVVPPIATIELSATTVPLMVGASHQLSATLKGADGFVLTGRQVTWASSAAGVASVDANGRVTAGAVGTAVITATVEGKSASADVTVEPAPPIIPVVDAGASRTCGLTNDGQAYCWGFLMESNESYRVQLTPEAVPGGLTFRYLSVGGHTCGITTSGAGYCWGKSETHAPVLGNGSTASRANPTLVAGGHNWKQISAGTSHTCGITTAGVAYCWGYNNHSPSGTGREGGALGNGGTNNASTPSLVSGNHVFRQVVANGTYSCAITTDGTLYCWGSIIRMPYNETQTGFARVPMPVAGAPRLASISGGEFHILGVTATGEAYQYPRDPGQSSQDIVQWAPGQTFKSVSAGRSFNVGITTDGTAYASGVNELGQLGDGTTVTPVGIVRVGGTQSFETVNAGQTHVMALTSDGAAWGWGHNAGGTLGDGTEVNRSTPVPPAAPSYTLGVPATASVEKGGSSSMSITITRKLGGFTLEGPRPFTGSVALAATGAPTGVTTSFSPEVITTGNTSSLTFSASSSAATGASQMLIRGTSEGLEDRVGSSNLIVNDPPPPPPPGGLNLVCTSESTPSTFPSGYQCVSNGSQFQVVKYDLGSQVTGTWVDTSAGLCINWGLSGKPNMATGRYRNGGLAGAPTTTPEGKWGAIVNSRGELPSATQFYVFTAILDDQTKLVAYSNGVVVGGGNFTKGTCPW